MVRKCFYSFAYKDDNWRVATVRSMGKVEGNPSAPDNDWETIKNGGDNGIRNWIAAQMKGRSCTIVLVGTDTANRRWINHEIRQSWNGKMGVVGIYIHGLHDKDGKVSEKGKNPFDFIPYDGSGKKLSSIVKCYTPCGSNSKERYAWIKDNIARVTNEAVRIRMEVNKRRGLMSPPLSRGAP